MPTVRCRAFRRCYTEGVIKQDLLKVLVCPKCLQPLVYRAESDTLKCNQCRRVFPIRDGIPVLLVDQATIEP